MYVVCIYAFVCGVWIMWYGVSVYGICLFMYICVEYQWGTCMCVCYVFMYVGMLWAVSICVWGYCVVCVMCIYICISDMCVFVWCVLSDYVCGGGSGDDDSGAGGGDGCVCVWCFDVFVYAVCFYICSMFIDICVYCAWCGMCVYVWGRFFCCPFNLLCCFVSFQGLVLYEDEMDKMDMA